MTRQGTACLPAKASSMPTACFEDTLAAVMYYKTYGYSRQDVKDKIFAGEVMIGKPTLREGESLELDKDRRYWIVTED